MRLHINTALMMSTCISIQAAVIWEEDFESAAVGAVSGNNQTLAGSVVQTANGASGTVVNAATDPAAAAAFSLASGNFFRLSCDDNAFAAIRPSLNPIEFDQVSNTNTYTLSFDLYLPSAVVNPVGDIQPRFRLNGAGENGPVDDSQATGSAGQHHVEYSGLISDFITTDVDEARPFIGIDQDGAVLTNYLYLDNIRFEVGSLEVPPNDAWFETLRTERVESDPSIVWRQFGPGMSGNNYRVYWHPTDPDVVFLGPNMGNAYRSVDRGTTYEGILDYDGKGHAFDDRGPSEINSPDFSRQHPDLGFCSREAESKLYKTTDRGKTWTRMTSTESIWDGKRLNTIAVAPTDDQIWYVGSGDINDRNKYFFTAANPHGYGSASGHEAKIWKTEDQGATWSDITPAGINPDACIVRIIVHPEDADTVWAATTYGLYKTTDGGSVWVHKTGAGLDNDIIRSFDMHYDSSSGEITLYAVDQVIWADAGNTVTNAGGGIFRSLDEGESWQNINGDLGVDISVLKSDYLFKTSYFNALKKWFGISDAESVYTVYPTNLLNNFSMVRVDPNDADKIFILNDYKHYGGSTTFRGGMVWRTDDGGAHWYATLRNGTAWEGTHKSYWEGRGNPTEHNMFLRGQKKWEQRDSYERKAGSAIEFNADGTMLMFQWAKTLVVSMDGGDTWEEIDEIEVTPGSEIWVAAENSNLPGHGLKQDPRFPDTIFLPSGENDFWVIEPGGDSVRSGYQAARRVEMGSSEYSCSDVAIHPTDTNIIYTLQFRQASAGDLLKSTDGGQTFVEHGVALEWPPGESENDSIDQLCLTINPDDPDYMFFCVPDDAAVHGYTWDPQISLTTGVRRSTDGGLSWEWANNGLPSEDVVALRLDPENSSNLYACVYGDNGGLYISTDNAASWSKYTKLPEQIYSVSDLHFSSDGKMYVSCGKHSDYDVDKGGVWMSDDDGESWSQIFKTHWARMTKTAVYDPDVILVQMNSKGTSDIQNPGTYLSKDGGLSWSKINTGNPQSDRVNDIAIDQVVRDRYYVSTQGCGWLRADLIDTNNVAPQFADSVIERFNLEPGTAYWDSIAGEASDGNGDAIIYSKVWGADWLNVAEDGTLSGTPPADGETMYTCQVQADDGNGQSSRAILNLAAVPSGVLWSRTFAAMDDADVKGTDPDGNFGSNTALKLDADLPRHAYVQFDLSQIDGMVSNAVLWLHSKTFSNATITAYTAASGWDEATVTYNSKNDLGAEVGSIRVAGSGLWYGIDVTSSISGDGQLTFGLLSDSQENMQIHSKEFNGGEFAPYLELHHFSTNPVAYYAAWVGAFPDIGSETGFEDDPDQDGLQNLTEYALGGNPIEDDPEIYPAVESSEAGVAYVYRKRVDAETAGLNYELLTSTNLTSDSWSSSGYTVSGTGTVDSVIQLITNTVTDIENQQFFKLELKISD
ncbi:DNRLRE domain-containing protein [Verrucomicrobia bacterium S94]|nr:DNRLRE domain-containing protein [Verrucomicrobia bacterium S94]